MLHVYCGRWCNQMFIYCNLWMYAHTTGHPLRDTFSFPSSCVIYSRVYMPNLKTSPTMHTSTLMPHISFLLSNSQVTVRASRDANHTAIAAHTARRVYSKGELSISVCRRVGMVAVLAIVGFDAVVIWGSTSWRANTHNTHNTHNTRNTRTQSRDRHGWG